LFLCVCDIAFFFVCFFGVAVIGGVAVVVDVNVAIVGDEDAT
jgi:hypothetical protein